MVEWAAEAIWQSGLDGMVCVLSTDDEEIAEIGRNAGLKVPFMRPTELSGDDVPMQAVALHASDWLTQNEGFVAKSIMVLQPTCPFRPPEVLVQAIQMLKDPSVDAVMGVKPIYRSQTTLFYMSENLSLTPLDDNEEIKSQRQEVQPIYTPNGALYLIRSDKLHNSRGFFPLKSRGIIMDQIASIDIDDSIDWQIAEAIVNNKLTGGN